MPRFKDIPGYEGRYAIDKQGVVLDKLKNKPISITYRKDGSYPLVSLETNGRFKQHKVHVLVAQTYLKQPKLTGRIIVNHKDGNKENFKLSNLEWMSQTENNYHAFANGLAHNNLRPDNKYGQTGIRKNKSGTFTPTVVFRKKQYYGGSYANIDDAKEARKIMKSNILNNIKSSLIKEIYGPLGGYLKSANAATNIGDNFDANTKEIKETFTSVPKIDIIKPEVDNGVQIKKRTNKINNQQ